MHYIIIATLCFHIQVAEYIETKLGCCYETFVQRASAIQYVLLRIILYSYMIISLEILRDCFNVVIHL